MARIALCGPCRVAAAEEVAAVVAQAVTVILPARGGTVTVTLDKAGFLRAVVPADRPEAIPMPNSAPGVPVSHKDRTITRLAVLKAAAEYSASKPESKSTDVLKIAASWEAWVLRDDEEPAEAAGAE